jgi:ubiquinone/menaquinone biosynthesis C-methylase UbiE
VAGIDHSAGMLAQATAKAAQRGLTARTEFHKMDAEALAFPDGSFDAVVSLFVLLHLPDPGAAVREMHRVLTPGGRLVIGVGSGPSLFTPQGVSAAVNTVLARIAEARGRLLASPDFLRELMHEHGLAGDPETARHHDAPDVATVLQDAGFANVKASWLGTTVALDPEEFWSVQAIYDSAVRGRLANFEPPKVAALKADFLDRANRVRARGGKLVYRYGAMVYATQR